MKQKLSLEQIIELGRAGTLEGVFDNIPLDVYHREFQNYVSSSGLCALDRSPQHFLAYLRKTWDPTDDQILGTAIHQAALEPELFYEQNAEGPEAARNTVIWKDFVKANPGKTCWKPKEWERITLTAQNIVNHPKIAPMIPSARIERSIFWKDPVTGVLCRCRPDILFADGLCPDLKTTKDASPEGFSWAVEDYQYNMRQAFYMEGIERVLGVKPPAAILLAAEKEDPYVVQPYYLAPDAEFGIDPLEVGQKKFRALLQRYADCQKAGIWPAYSDGQFLPLHLPATVNRKHHFAAQGEEVA